MKCLKTEINDDEDNKNDNKRFFYRNIQTSDLNHYRGQTFDSFLDYTFRQKKNSIYKEKSKAKILNYNYELEQTISLNLEILLTFMNNSKSNNNNKKIIIMNDNKSRDTAESNSTISTSAIIQLIKNIREKVKKKGEINRNINNLINKINDRIDYNKNYYLKIKEQKLKFKQKISKNNNALDNMDNYIIVMNKKFYKIQTYIDKIIVNKKNNILNSNKHNNIFDFIFAFIANNKKAINFKKEIKNYNTEISDIKIENEFIKEEKELYSDKSNYDLIRCMEFYRRINFELYHRLKSVKKRFNLIIEIMDFLNLGNIVKFTQKKSEENPNFEIEFSKINKESSIDLFPNVNKSINFSITLDE
jgi:hypothetical protein